MWPHIYYIYIILLMQNYKISTSETFTFNLRNWILITIKRFRNCQNTVTFSTLATWPDCPDDNRT